MTVTDGCMVILQIVVSPGSNRMLNYNIPNAVYSKALVIMARHFVTSL